VSAPRVGAAGAAFETLELRDGRPFALGRLLDRLRASLAAMGADAPPAERLRAAVARTAAAWGAEPGRLRLTVLVGSDAAPPTVLAAVAPLRVQATPVEVITTPWPTNERGPLSESKTAAFADHVAAVALARRRGVGEALAFDRTGRLCEASTTVAVLALDGRLVTPPLGPGVLPGVTRQLLIEAMAASDDPIAQQPVTAGDLARAEELFLLSTARPVQPVSAVDGRRLPWCPGRLTRMASRTWHRAYDGVADP
jgi:branched-chain amino acid aminotransferase